MYKGHGNSATYKLEITIKINITELGKLCRQNPGCKAGHNMNVDFRLKMKQKSNDQKETDDHSLNLIIMSWRSE